MKPLLVVGSSGHAGAVIDAIELQAKYQILGLIDSFEARHSTKYGYAICGPLEEALSLAESHSCSRFFVALGDNWARHEVAGRLRAAIPSVEFPVILHPSVVVARSTQIGPGTVMLAGSLAANNARIGEGCIVYMGSTINHDCGMDDYSSVSAGVHIGGRSSIGLRSSIGIGSTVREKVTIGKDSVVGAGAVVLNDLPDECVAYGVPAKVARRRQPNEKYMR